MTGLIIGLLWLAFIIAIVAYNWRGGRFHVRSD